MRLRSQSLPLEQTGEEGCEQWQQSALEKEGGRRGHKVEVVHKAKDLRAVGILLPSGRTWKRDKREKGSEGMGFHSPL